MHSVSQIHKLKARIKQYVSCGVFVVGARVANVGYVNHWPDTRQFNARCRSNEGTHFGDYREQTAVSVASRLWNQLLIRLLTFKWPSHTEVCLIVAELITDHVLNYCNTKLQALVTQKCPLRCCVCELSQILFILSRNIPALMLIQSNWDTGREHTS